MLFNKQLPTTKRAPLPYAITLGPPLVFAIAYPDIFFDALNFAGVFGVLVLFGVLPGAMAWSERYSSLRGDLPRPVAPLIPGGKFSLVLIMGAASTIILSDLVQRVF